MSMKHTKGKQKIEMKKVEDNGARMVTFSKRKAGIFKKMNEIAILCDVEAAFLAFSKAGKPYSFGCPSVDEVFGRLKSSLKHEPSVKEDTNIGPLVEAHKRKKIEDLMKKYFDLVEELEMEKNKEKILKESKSEKKLDKMWWNIPAEGLSVEELKQRHHMFLELHASLCGTALQRLGNDDGGSSSGLAGRGHCGGPGGGEAET